MLIKFDFSLKTGILVVKFAQETKNEYANNSSVSPALLWETIKLKIREASLNNAKQRKKERADQTEELERP